MPVDIVEVAIVDGGSGLVTGTWSPVIVTLPPNESTELAPGNEGRKGLRWMNIGANPFTAVPGIGDAVVGLGFNYDPGKGNAASLAGAQGGGDDFGQTIGVNAFQAISLLGTSVCVWELT